MTLNQFIQDLMIESLFNVQETTMPDIEGSVHFYTSKNSERADYWLVWQVESLQIVLDQQNLVFDYIKKQYGSKADLEKNISLLVLYQIDDTSVDTYKPLVHELEEDPYLFKKHVLYYTNKEVESFLTALSKEQNKIDTFTKWVNDNKIFEDYKSSLKGNTVSPYSLVFKMAIKLPFIPLNTQTETHTPKTLEDRIQTALASKNFALPENETIDDYRDNKMLNLCQLDDSNMEKGIKALIGYAEDGIQ
jgi:hypothetical protein